VRADALPVTPQDGDLFCYRSLVGVIVERPSLRKHAPGAPEQWEFTTALFGVFKLRKEDPQQVIPIGAHVTITRADRTKDQICQVTTGGQTVIGLCVDFASEAGDEFVRVKLHGMAMLDPEEIERRINIMEKGVSHGGAVERFLNDPDTPGITPDDLFIVGSQPTGIFAGHTGEVAYKTDETTWVFEPPVDGDAHLIRDLNETWIYNERDKDWHQYTQNEQWSHVGDIKQTVLAENELLAEMGAVEFAKWALADGRNVTGTDYAVRTGRGNLPDLRGAFFRMAGQNASNGSWNGGALNAYQEDATARSKNPMTTNSDGSHQHYSGAYYHAPSNKYGIVNNNTTGIVVANTGTNFAQQLVNTSSAGAHTHLIDGGGDAETRPKSYAVNVFIRVMK
jgi:hypothetical protein